MIKPPNKGVRPCRQRRKRKMEPLQARIFSTEHLISKDSYEYRQIQAEKQRSTLKRPESPKAPGTRSSVRAVLPDFSAFLADSLGILAHREKPSQLFSAF